MTAIVTGDSQGKPAPLWPPEYKLHPDHCGDVLRGCYDLPVEPATILDIGANVGAFARWASARWPAAAIHCYEPHPANFHLLNKTVARYSLPHVYTHNSAIADKPCTATLHENGFNCGEWSLLKFTKEGDGKIDVGVMDAATLPEADFIKIDTEGSELIILKRLADSGLLARARAVVLEYHASVHVALLIFIALAAGLRLHSVQPISDHRGLLRFVAPS